MAHGIGSLHAVLDVCSSLSFVDVSVDVTFSIKEKRSVAQVAHGIGSLHVVLDVCSSLSFVGVSAHHRGIIVLP